MGREAPDRAQRPIPLHRRIAELGISGWCQIAEAAGYASIEALANADPAGIPDVLYLKGDKKVRAALQAKSWKTGETIKLGDIDLPSGMLGLMTTKSPEIETADSLKRRIDDASRFIKLDRLCVSPQCGFASVTGRVRPLVELDQTERKLARLVEVAKSVWGAL